jgi:hypothetical protein
MKISGGEVLKISSFYEELINLENKTGHLVIYSELGKNTIATLKRRGTKITKKDFKNIFWEVMKTGLIFVPKKGFVIRTSNWGHR